MPDNRCVYCNEDSSVNMYTTSDIFGDSYSLRKCNNCRAIFLAPRPTEAQLSNAYDTSYYGDNEEKFVVPMAERFLDFFRKVRAKRVSALLGEDAKVLDIGCGNGRFLLFLKKKSSCQIFGTELDGNSAKRASQIPGINLTIGKLDNNYFEDRFFDAITLFHVFEHLSDPRSMIAEITRIVKNDGYIVFSFPNIISNQSKWFKGLWLHLDPPRHLFFFEPDDFKRTVHELGFNVISERYVSTEQNPFGMVQSILNVWSSKRELLFEKMKGNNDYISDYSKFKLLLHSLFFYFSFPLFILTDLIAGIFKKGATVEFVVQRKK